MKMRTLLFGCLWSLLFLSSQGFSADGGSDRGGGNAVICYDNEAKEEMKSTELFDFWERRDSPEESEKLDLGSPNLSVEAKVEIALNRLSVFDPTAGSLLKRRAKDLLKDIEKHKVDGPLEFIKDDFSSRKPKAPCYKVRFAVQESMPYSYGNVNYDRNRISISKIIYDSSATNNDVRAGIVLHELIYELARANGLSNSEGVRFFVYLLSSDYFASKTQEQFDALAKVAQFPKLSFSLALPGGRIFLDLNSFVFGNREAIRIEKSGLFRLSSSMKYEDSFKSLNLVGGHFVKLHYAKDSKRLVTVEILGKASTETYGAYDPDGVHGWVQLLDGQRIGFKGKIRFAVADAATVSETKAAAPFSVGENQFVADGELGVVEGRLTRATGIVKMKNGEIIDASVVDFASNGQVKIIKRNLDLMKHDLEKKFRLTVSGGARTALVPNPWILRFDGQGDLKTISCIDREAEEEMGPSAYREWYEYRYRNTISLCRQNLGQFGDSLKLSSNYASPEDIVSFENNKVEVSKRSGLMTSPNRDVADARCGSLRFTGKTRIVSTSPHEVSYFCTSPVWLDVPNQ